MGYKQFSLNLSEEIDELIKNSKPIDKDLIEKAKKYFKSREPIVQERINQIKEDLANGIIIPSAFNKGVVESIAKAVADAAVKSGVARI